MSDYYCKECNQIINRESNEKRIKSFCETTGKNTWLVAIRWDILLQLWIKKDNRGRGLKTEAIFFDEAKELDQEEQIKYKELLSNFPEGFIWGIDWAKDDGENK